MKCYRSEGLWKRLYFFPEEAERLKLAVLKQKTFNMLSSAKIIHWVKFKHSKERRSLVCLQLFTNVF